MKTLVLVPGFNEIDKDLSTLIDGRRGRPGFAARGFECMRFPRQSGVMREHIDRFAEFLAELKTKAPEKFPVATLGYSEGGLVVRGFLRAYPERSAEVSHTIQVGSPNWGVTAMIMPRLTGLLRIPDRAMRDMDLNSDFLHWLNGTGGHWEHRKGTRTHFWVLDTEPSIAPEGAKLLAIIGQVPPYGDDNDGLVWCDSATLGGRIPYVSLHHFGANHFNLIGIFSWAMLLTKWFFADNRIWPMVVEAAANFILRDDIAPSPDSARAVDPMGYVLNEA